jgi:hypothetical protein
MKTPWLHVLTGVVWGLLLGTLAAVFAVAAGAGFSWLYLFGDAPWPESVAGLLPAFGLGVFAIVLLPCTILGLRAGRLAAAAAPEEAVRRQAGARRLLAAGTLLALLLAGAAAARIAGQDEARETAADRAAGFEALQSGRQHLTAISAARAPRPMGYDLDIVTRGARGGAYRLTWALRSSGTQGALAEGDAELTLEPGDNRASLPLDARAIVERYHQLALGGRDVKVEVAEHFRLEATLTPVLDEAARKQLPAHEAQNLALGYSALTDRATADLEMQFRIAGSEYELLD